MTDANITANTSASVDRISVKIPPFWPNDPEIWFLQVENQFTLANITSDATKFNYIVANLDTAYILEVRDIIVSPPATERYAKLKSELIKRLVHHSNKRLKDYSSMKNWAIQDLRSSYDIYSL
uniref:Uncharacterized protein LOC114330710 isoform X1 n=1 Tax=Diabrotica virgifera virgifera TaxID=50390 RepID=A0A6P7FJ12_DIAVI